MPRTRTTLVEQILLTHPAVFGAGERQDLHELATSVAFLSRTQNGYPEGVRDLGREDLERVGDAYVHRLSASSGGAARVTDKAPMNFCHLGLLRLIAPGARVIHCVRDPLDTCFSCYDDFGLMMFHAPTTSQSSGGTSADMPT